MSDKVWTVYSIIKDNEIVYIGSTSQALRKRLNAHRRTKGLSRDYTIRKICLAHSKREAENKEEHLINLIGLHRLMNKIANQRHGGLGKTHTEEARRKISEANKKRKVTWVKKWDDERRERSIKAMTGVKKGEGLINKTLKKLGMPEFDLYKNGEFIGRFINQTHAATALGMKKSTFVDIFKGKRINKKGIEVKYV